MEGASGFWKPSSLTRRWGMGPRSATESVGFGRREYRADDKGCQRLVHLLRSRSRTPRRGCFASEARQPSRGICRWCIPIEAVGSTSIELAPGAGLPEMVVLRGLVIPKGFGPRGSKGGKASAESFEGYRAEPSAPRRGETISTTKTLRKRRTRRALGKSNGSEGAQASSRLQKSVRGTLPASMRGAERQTKRTQGSGDEASHPRRGGTRRFRDKGVEGLNTEER